jgi:hypothetical protein
MRCQQSPLIYQPVSYRSIAWPPVVEAWTRFCQRSFRRDPCVTRGDQGQGSLLLRGTAFIDLASKPWTSGAANIMQLLEL